MLGIFKIALRLRDPHVFKDTHRGKAPSNKAPALIKITNMGIWIVGTSNQLPMRVFKLKQNLQKYKVVTDETLLIIVQMFEKCDSSNRR